MWAAVSGALNPVKVMETFRMSATSVTTADPLPVEAVGGVSFAPERVVEKIVAADIGIVAIAIPMTAVRLVLTKKCMDDTPYMRTLDARFRSTITGLFRYCTWRVSQQSPNMGFARARQALETISTFKHRNQAASAVRLRELQHQ